MYLKQVKQFMIVGNQPVLDTPQTLSPERARLRLSLIVEELTELAEALGKPDILKDLFAKQLYKLDDMIANPKPANLVEQLDAYCDLEYVLIGAIHESGMGTVFNEAFNDVHNSNMTKFVNNSTELLNTYVKYKKEGIEVFFGNSDKNPEDDTNYPTPVYRSSDKKVLKSINYTPVDLNKYIKNVQE